MAEIKFLPQQNDDYGAIGAALSIANAINGIVTSSEERKIRAKKLGIEDLKEKREGSGASALLDVVSKAKVRPATPAEINDSNVKKQTFNIISNEPNGFTPTQFVQSEEDVNEKKIKDYDRKIKEQQATFGPGTELRKEFEANPITKNTSTVLQSFDKIAKAAHGNTSTDNISLIYAYMKIVDPTSSVKEGEFSTAENSGGIPSRIRNTYNKVLEGTLLTPEQRSNFLKSSQDLTQAQLDRQKTINDRYAGLAQKMNVDPSLVIQQSPLFSNELVKNQTRSNTQESKQKASPLDSISLDAIDAAIIKKQGIKSGVKK